MADTTDDGPVTYNGEIITHPNLYVRNLPPNMDQTAVEVLFRRFGTCTGCKFFKTAAVPYAFLRLGKPSEALAAVKALNGSTVSGKMILVKSADSDAVYDLPNENLYVRNIPVSWNEEDIRQFFQKYGPLVSVRVLPPVATSVGQVAMVRFQQLEHAQAARDGANATVPTGEHLPLNVKFADNQDEKARKQHSRLVKAGSNGVHDGPSHSRYAPYPGAAGPPRFPLPPPGMDMMMPRESPELMPFGAPPPGVLMPPPQFLGEMGIPPPPWDVSRPPVMAGVPPPPAHPLPQRQHTQPQPNQPPVLTASGQYIVPHTVPGEIPPQQLQRLPVQQQQQSPPPGTIPVPLQAPAMIPGQQAPVLPQQRSQAPKLQSSGAPQLSPLPGQSSQPPGQPQPLLGAQPSPATYAAPAGAPSTSVPGVSPPFPGYDPNGVQHFVQQPYATAPYAYPVNPHDPYAQAQTQQQQAYDAQAAAYYAAYYGHPPPYGSQPGGSWAAPAAAPAASVAPGQQPAVPAGHPDQSTDPYHAYYYYHQYYGSMAQPQQPQQPQPQQPQPQQPQPQQPQPQPQPQQLQPPKQPLQSQHIQSQQPYTLPPQGSNAGAGPAPANATAPVAYSVVPQAAPGQQSSVPTGGGPQVVGTAPAQQQQQAQAATLPWQVPTIPQQPNGQTQQQQPQVSAPNQKMRQLPTAVVASMSQQHTAQVINPLATATGGTANGVTATANGTGTVTACFKPTGRVFVSDLPADADKILVYESFAPYGAVLAVHVTAGRGAVDYVDYDSAVRAAASMNGAKIRGVPITVVLADTS